MRTRNAFKLVKGRIEYADFIKEAVLNPRMTGLKIHLNGGFDWIDQRYGFIKLLLTRGQVREVTTHQDLLAHDDYLQAMVSGRTRVSVDFDCINAPIFGVDRDKKRAGWASEKRMRNAAQKFQTFKQELAS